ncbi:MAG: hypothetical protein ABIJ84_00125 [bacterium]
MNQEKDLAINLPVRISELSAGLVFTAVSILSFFVPFTLGHPQWLVGTIVNACLFLGATYLPKRYFIPLAILPSLGVLARGLIFGPFTLLLIYFLPFIWLGNLVLIFSFRYVYSNVLKNNRIAYLSAAFFSSSAKFIFLFLIANIYFKLSIVPALFLQLMGLNQLATALAGGLVALGILMIFRGLKIKSLKID